MNEILKPKKKYYWKFLIQYGINQFKTLSIFISLFSGRCRGSSATAF